MLSIFQLVLVFDIHPTLTPKRVLEFLGHNLTLQLYPIVADRAKLLSWEVLGSHRWASIGATFPFSQTVVSINASKQSVDSQYICLLAMFPAYRRPESHNLWVFLVLSQAIMKSNHTGKTRSSDSKLGVKEFSMLFKRAAITSDVQHVFGRSNHRHLE